ncbi:MAG: UDP-N-acetylmuramoyl-L-alanyl-D-glutamate--2,6-diaminopimelate ligase [Wenzhouxiangellaceae bacterium]|nr:UDP-N-acetylmuramoyl-L-alanyl-D-glutamate--2,6-diaminopimelate ligase [Wenzhouxiangellaceae bacterium]
MKRLEQIGARFEVPVAAPGIEVRGLSIDSRRVRPGDAFVALAGEQGHGLEHAEAALAAGAVAVLHDAADAVPAALGGRALGIPDLASRAAELAAWFHDRPADDMDLVGVTGTNGKSSIAWLLAQALDGAMIGTLGIGRPGELAAATHTTPDVFSLHRALAELRDEGVEHVVLEVSSHALEQRRIEGLAFTTTIFTNLGHDHLDFHRSRDAYGRAKRRLFTDHPARRQLINVDDAFGRLLVESLGGSAEARVLGYGLDRRHSPDALGTLKAADLDGLSMEVRTPEGSLSCRAPLIGRVNAWNVLVVATELLLRGGSAVQVARCIESLKPVPGRMNRVVGPRGQQVVIDYAHTPDALESALASLRELATGRLICAFGCGGDRDREKRPRMGEIAEALADAVVLCNDNPRGEEPLKILREIQSGMARPDRAPVVPDRLEAITRAVAMAEPGDVVLIAGKGHETEQVIGEEVRHFSDFEAVRQALEAAA